MEPQRNFSKQGSPRPDDPRMYGADSGDNRIYGVYGADYDGCPISGLDSDQFEERPKKSKPLAGRSSL